MSGRAAGYCAGYDRPGFMNPAPGRGYGRGFGGGFGRGRGGRGRGFGWGNGPGGYGGWGAAYAAPPAAPNPQDEKAFLQQEADALQGDLERIQQRLEELGKE
ncbi:MAG: DUF5320 domain-containing protein [Candidatus Sumerlaeia bacterium]